MENKVSLTDFLESYKNKFTTQTMTEQEFKGVPDVVYSRAKRAGSKYFLHFNQGFLTLTDLEFNSMPISRFIRNEFQRIFTSLFILLENRVIEVLISESSAIQLTFQDIFNLNQLEPFDTAKIRFNVLQKLFRETQRSDFFYFNLPSIQFSSLFLEKMELDPTEKEKDLFLFNSPFPVKIV